MLKCEDEEFFWNEASGEKKREKTTSDILRMVKKRISDEWKKSRGKYEARATNLRENGQGLEGTLLRSSNDDKKYHQNY